MDAEPPVTVKTLLTLGLCYHSLMKPERDTLRGDYDYTSLGKVLAGKPGSVAPSGGNYGSTPYVGNQLALLEEAVSPPAASLPSPAPRITPGEWRRWELNRYRNAR